MDYMQEIEKEWKETESKYLSDVDAALSVLKTLRSNYNSPGTSWEINSAKVSRARLIVNDLLKRY